MFSRMQLLATADEVANRFSVQLPYGCIWNPSQMISAFEHLRHPIITTEDPQLLDCTHHWGLVPPDWKKSPEAIWNRTISAKLEYVQKRYSWKKVAQNRCLIPVSAYFEYHWNDPKGKSKTRFMIRHTDCKIVALAGLYSRWTSGNEILNTFAVCTTMGNEIMKYVHNKDLAKDYYRMPVMLNPGDEHNWLDKSIHHMAFAYPNYRPSLMAEPETEGLQGTLF